MRTIDDVIGQAEILMTMPLWKSRHVAEDIQAELVEVCELWRTEGTYSTESQELFDRAMALADHIGNRLNREEQYDRNAALEAAKFDATHGRRRNTLPALWGEDGTGTGILVPSSPARRTMASLFGAPTERNPWRSSGEFFAAVASGRFHPGLVQYSAAMSEGSATAGGFLVPQELAYAILDEALHQEVVRPLADVTPMLSQTKLVPAYDGIDQSALASLYGFTFQWLEESQQVDPGQGKVRAIMLTAHLGGIYLAASNELLADAPEFEGNLTTRIIKAVSENMDFAFLRGNGISKPLGVLQSPGRLVVPKETSQVTGTLVWANVTKMFSANTNQANAVWVCSPQALPQLLSLTIVVGDGGSYIPAVTIGPTGGMTMLTRPLLLSSKLPTLGNEGDLIFCDFSQYYIGLRKDVGLEMSAHVGFTRNEAAWRCLVRVDGQPKASKPYKAPDGQSYSPFVTLQARA